jgi:hypothetical protein
MRILPFFVILVMLSTDTYARSGKSSTQLPPSPIPNKKESSLSVTAAVQGTNSAIEHQDGTDRKSLDFGFYTNYKPSKNWSYTFILEGSQNLVDSEKSDLSNIFLQTSIYPQKLNPSFTLTPNFNLGFPASRKARDIKGQILSPGPSVVLGFNPVSFPKLKTWTSIGIFKNIFKYTTGLDGIANTDYSSRQILSVTFNFTKKFYFYSEFHHVNRVDYFGVASESYETKEELNYEFIENYLLWVGHANNGNIFMPNGYSSNVSLYNENQSNVYGGLGATFKF